MKKIFKKYEIQFKLLLALTVGFTTSNIIYYLIMPIILNYPKNIEEPNSIFLIILISLITLVLFGILIFYKTRFILKYNDIFEDPKKYKTQDINYVRNKLFTVPYFLFIYSIIIPSILLTFVHSCLLHEFGFVTLKIFILVLTLATLFATIIFIYNCNIFKKLLIKLPYNSSMQIKKSSIKKRILFNILPMITVSILFTSLLDYPLILITSAILVVINIIILILFSKNLSADIDIISSSFLDITKNKDTTNMRHLTVTSNDEFSDLIISFNKIQQLTKSNIKKIHEDQETLMESERLSSLGQLIGGIAHNLKTPIMSISGATEGLKDLVKEYELSIDDPEVNNQDHHDIAKDMSKWIEKIKEYTEYMSDIITAVKGQAVAMSNEEDITFTINELVKRIDILMKHELKRALISLDISIKVNENLTLHGDVNNLVQVINNMISNSIQAYDGKTNESIKFDIYQKDNNIIFSIKDTAGRITKKS